MAIKLQSEYTFFMNGFRTFATNEMFFSIRILCVIFNRDKRGLKIIDNIKLFKRFVGTKL